MNFENKMKTLPKDVFSEYKIGTEFKDGIGDRGIAEQSKINERFYYGDQWHGLPSANSRPLVRRNVIRRIGDFKLSSIAAAPIAVNYSADGIPDNNSLKEQKENYRNGLLNGDIDFEGSTDNVEIGTIMSVLSSYFATTAERVKFDYKKERLLRNAYISGTSVAYTYWNPNIKTGLYADEDKTKPIDGDIDFQIVNIENVIFGDPNCDEVQKQPYIIIAQRLDYEEVRREAYRNGIAKSDIVNIIPDGTDNFNVNVGTYGENELSDSRRVTMLTKFWKEWNKDKKDWKIMCEKVTEKSFVKQPFDIGIKLYPFAVFRWSDRYGTAYGESDVTYQVPNQVAINKALSAEIYSIMTTGMPKTLVNGDLVNNPITNDPGEIIKIYGTSDEVSGAVKYLNPPSFSGQLINAVNDLAESTLTDNGATEAALGQIRPDNAAAIIQMRDASLQPLQLYQNKFYSCIEDIARIWADFWVNLYGDRSLKISDNMGSYYVPFHAARYKSVIITAKIDVGSSPIYSVSAAIATLDNMFGSGIIDRIQYLERLPDGIIEDKTGLLEQARKQQEAMLQQESQNELTDEELLASLKVQYPDQYEEFVQMTPEEQQMLLNELRGGVNSQPQAPQELETMEVGDI